MLIEFSLENFRTFKLPCKWSMVANSDKTNLELNTFSAIPSAPNLLNAAALYGGNGTGKTSLIKALRYMQDLVINSAKESQLGEELDGYDPFLFDPEFANKPTDFDVIFVEKNVRYQYGFQYDENKILQEWLFAWPEGRMQRWFERQLNQNSGETEWYFGPKFFGKKSVWKDATRDNALFLSTAVMLNNEQLKPVFYWFQNRLRILMTNDLPPHFTAEACKNDVAFKQQVLKYLNLADFGIEDIEVVERDISPEHLATLFPDADRAFLEEFQKKPRKLRNIYIHHRTGDSVCKLELARESDGTQILFALLGPIIEVLELGLVLVVDELNAHMHPKLVRFIVELFCSSENKNHAQLLFSTHASELLEQNLLRRDQIWFTEKIPEYGYSVLYPLTDHQPRKKEPLQKGYGEGRYGGVPMIESLREA